MIAIDVHDATLADIEALAPRLRADDAAEVAAMGVSPEAALRRSLDISHWAHAAWVDGEIAAMWGLHIPHLASATAYPWLLTTAVVERHRKLFVATSRSQIAIWQSYGFALEGAIDGRYARAQRWLWHLGFALSPGPLMKSGIEFKTYRKEAA